MNTISFKEAIKMVHPDTNPNILDAGEKVRMVMMHKNDESALYKMLNTWGLIGAGPAPKEEPELKYRRITLMRNMVYNGWAMANVVGLGNCIIQKTTKKRVYFHEETKKRTGRAFCSFNKVRFAVRAERV